MTTTIDAVLDTLADRLADPEHTGATNAALNGGTGLAVLYAELGRADPAHRATAHRYLAHANDAMGDAGAACLYDGVPSVAFAAHAAAQQAGDYGALLDALDESVRHIATSILGVEWERIRAGEPSPTSRNHDVVYGLTGTGRYLLRRRGAHPETEPVLRALLDYLVALTRPVRVDGVALPGWWVAGGGTRDAADDGGNADLGVAHGVPGPLALLALAWCEGLRVEGHREAIEVVVDHLLAWAVQDGAGHYWPDSISREAFLRGRGAEVPARAGWCYGIPGVARALQLAGLALGRDDWSQLALGAVHGMFGRPESSWGVHDARLCHGWAGLLHVVGRIDADAPTAGLRDHVDHLARRTVEAFDPDLRYGYRKVLNAWEPGPVDDPGLLNGAAGIALALQAHRTGAPPLSGWDAALLVA